MASFAAGTPKDSLFAGERLLLVGTYGQDLGFVKGEGAGIYAFRLTGTGTFGCAVFLNRPLVGADIVGANPTYLCKHPTKPGLVYVADEEDLAGGGRCRALQVTLGSSGAPECSPLGAEAVATGDSSPCHVVATADRLYMANYCGGAKGTGSAASFALDESGAPADKTTAPLPPGGRGVAFPREEPDVDLTRQEKAHAHMALASGDGSGLLVPDLGSDVVWRLAAPSLGDAEVACTLAPGDGPRHAAWHPSLNVLYVLCELSCRVVAFAVDRRTGRSLDKEPLAAARTLPPECYGGRATGPPTEPKSTCAALVVHPNGKWLYCSNRAVDVDGLVTRLEIEADGAVDECTAVHLSTGGRTPREIAFAGPNAELLLVANQDTNSILSFAVDGATGALERRHRVSCPTPVCLLDLGQPPATPSE
mmetsp:Transcript_8424/g.25176  ORF Transcript_8424/g.25176 Transcript_8424/m.25176 type:complete len:421 (+) Transcript_8424:1230-2492(+)